MKELGAMLKDLRKAKSLKINELARLAHIDSSLISRYESGNRVPSEKHIMNLAQALGSDYKELRKHFITAKVVQILSYEPYANEILIAAEERIKYLADSSELGIVNKLDSDVMERLARIDELQLKWKNKKPLSALQLNKMKSYFNIEYTYESNRIEGNTLTLQETELVVNQGLTISGKSMEEHLEAINHAEALEYIIELASSNILLNQRTLIELHRLILKSIDRQNAGVYRKVNVRIAGSEHIAPEHYRVAEFMEAYFHFYLKNKDLVHPVILAAEMHERLVSIHPFVDGNGQTARLVMNLILLRHGFTIANLKGDLKSRISYYKTLEEVQMNNQPREFYNFIIDAVGLSLRRHLQLA